MFLCRLHGRLVVVLAKLETLLPVYWNTSTRHYLLHLYEIILNLGNFWSISMLGVERLHVLIKKLGRYCVFILVIFAVCIAFFVIHVAKGKRNLLVTLQNSYSLFCQAQITWRGDAEHNWSKKIDPRSFLSKKPVPTATGTIQLLGKQRKVTACDWLFAQIQDHWTVLSKPYKRFRQRYETYVRNCNSNPLPFHNWKSFRPNPSESPENEQKRYEQERTWQSMNTQLWDVERIALDGVLFRTEPSQIRKGTISDNSYIIGETNVQDEDTHVTTREKCYGRIQKIHLHFMHPPSSEQVKQATDACRLDPYKISNIPWCVLLECKWYKVHDINPNSGLVQVQHRGNWNKGCPFIDTSHCFARNCMLWPSSPFDQQRYDASGVLLNDTTDNWDRSEELHDVIEHHE